MCSEFSHSQHPQLCFPLSSIKCSGNGYLEPIQTDYLWWWGSHFVWNVAIYGHFNVTEMNVCLESCCVPLCVRQNETVHYQWSSDALTTSWCLSHKPEHACLPLPDPVSQLLCRERQRNRLIELQTMCTVCFSILFPLRGNMLAQPWQQPKAFLWQTCIWEQRCLSPLCSGFLE